MCGNCPRVAIDAVFVLRNTINNFVEILLGSGKITLEISNTTPLPGIWNPTAFMTAG